TSRATPTRLGAAGRRRGPRDPSRTSYPACPRSPQSSRAPTAIGLPVSCTMRTASLLNSWSYLFLVSLIGYLLKADISTRESPCGGARHVGGIGLVRGPAWRAWQMRSLRLGFPCHTARLRGLHRTPSDSPVTV